jgi:hypothetical protein
MSSYAYVLAAALPLGVYYYTNYYKPKLPSPPGSVTGPSIPLHAVGPKDPADPKNPPGPADVCPCTVSETIAGVVGACKTMTLPNYRKYKSYPSVLMCRSPGEGEWVTPSPVCWDTVNDKPKAGADPRLCQAKWPEWQTWTGATCDGKEAGCGARVPYNTIVRDSNTDPSVGEQYYVCTRANNEQYPSLHLLTMSVALPMRGQLPKTPCGTVSAVV